MLLHVWSLLRAIRKQRKPNLEFCCFDEFCNDGFGDGKPINLKGVRDRNKEQFPLGSECSLCQITSPALGEADSQM